MSASSSSSTEPPMPRTPPSRESRRPSLKSFFGSSDSVSQWLPASLLIVTTAALAVPIALMRQQRRSQANIGGISRRDPPLPRRRGNILQYPKTAPYHPPPRRIVVSPLPSSSGNSVTTVGANAVLRSQQHPSSPSSPVKETIPPEGSVEDSLDGALYIVKAFAIATAAVACGALASVWSIQAVLGVSTVQEFADRMRHFVATTMPVLSSRIHRDSPQSSSLSRVGMSSLSAFAPESDAPLEPSEELVGAEATLPWEWPEAEKRLRAAFDAGGIYGWAQAVVAETEAEGQAERIKRDMMQKKRYDDCS